VTSPSTPRSSPSAATPARRTANASGQRSRTTSSSKRKIEETYGLEFDEEQAICYGCKELDKPEGVVLKKCDVRPCAREKKLDSCIECDDLATCDKELWTRFPDFRQKVLEMQEKYRQQT
jgi:hypothetical protein